MRNPPRVDARPRLYLNHDVDFDWLRAVEFGRVTEDQPQDRWTALSDGFAYLADEAGGRTVGFVVEDLPSFDEDAPEHEGIWRGPRFDAPVLGRIKDKSNVPFLIELFPKVAAPAPVPGQPDKGGLQDEIVTSLRSLTGQDFGKDIAKWKSWWKSAGAGFEIAK